MEFDFRYIIDDMEQLDELKQFNTQILCMMGN